MRTLETMEQLLTTLRDQHGSDRKAAPLVGVTQAQFSRWRNGEDFPADENALRIAELLQRDPAYVLAVIRLARAKSGPARATWQRIAEQFKDAAVVAAMAIGAASFGFPSPAQAGSAPLNISESVIHIARDPRRKKRNRWTGAIR